MIPKGWIRLTKESGEFAYIKAEAITVVDEYAGKMTLGSFLEGSCLVVKENARQIFDLITDVTKGEKE